MTQHNEQAQLEQHVLNVNTEIATAERSRNTSNVVANVARAAAELGTVASAASIAYMAFKTQGPKEAIEGIRTIAITGFTPSIIPGFIIYPIARNRRTKHNNRVNELNTHLTAITSPEVTPVTE